MGGDWGCLHQVSGGYGKPCPEPPNHEIPVGAVVAIWRRWFILLIKESVESAWIIIMIHVQVFMNRLDSIPPSLPPSHICTHTQSAHLFQGSDHRRCLLYNNTIVLLLYPVHVCVSWVTYNISCLLTVYCMHCTCTYYRQRERELREAEDARLAHQASLEEQKEIEERRKKEIQLSEREIERMHQLQLQKKAKMRYIQEYPLVRTIQ